MKNISERLLRVWRAVRRFGRVCLPVVAFVAAAFGRCGFLPDAVGATIVTQGSVINTAILGGTNCYAVNPGAGTTNVLSTNKPVVSVSGAAGPLAITYDIVADAAPGNTNNGIVRLVFEASLDDSLFTTGTNAFNVDIVHTGAARLISTTNIAASVLGGWSSVRLRQVATTNIGFFYITNLQYRVVQTLY